MALAHSPGVVTNGLVLYCDMANTKKSFKGQPTTNQFAIPTPDASGYVTFAVQGTSGFQRIYSGTYGGYTIQPTDIVYKYVLGAGPTACHYHGNTISVTAGQTPTWSFDYYIDPSTTGYPVTNYLANMESSIGVGAAISDPTPAVTGVWKRATQTSAAASANGTFNAYLYPGACGTQMATGGFILYKNPQVELNSFATPFTTSTRTTSNALVDITNNNTITATSLTYASDGSFSFSGSANYIDCGTGGALTLGNSGAFTVSAWIKISTLKTFSGIISKVQSDRGGVYSFMCTAHNDGTLAFYNNAAWYYSTNAGITTNTWYNVVFSFTGSVMSYYVNGVAYGTSSCTWPETTAHKVFIGSWYSPNTAYDFNGTISAAQLYNRALPATEITQNFNALRGRYGV